MYPLLVELFGGTYYSFGFGYRRLYLWVIDSYFAGNLTERLSEFFLYFIGTFPLIPSLCIFITIIYLSKNFPKDEERAAYPDLTDEEILETVGRGLTAYSIRFNSAMTKWDDELLEAAKNPRKKQQKDRPFEARDYETIEDIHIENNHSSPEDDFEPAKPNVYHLYTMDEMEAMPPAVALVDDIIADNSFGFIYGAPGCGKTFIAMSLGLSIAYNFQKWFWNSRPDQAIKQK